MHGRCGQGGVAPSVLHVISKTHGREQLSKFELALGRILSEAGPCHAENVAADLIFIAQTVVPTSLNCHGISTARARYQDGVLGNKVRNGVMEQRAAGG